MSNHVDRFYAAVAVLAGHGHIKQRLISAYEENLEAINEEELPIAAKNGFADLRTVMHRVAPSNGEGSICASVRKMSAIEASDCAMSVVELCREVSLDDVQAAPPIGQKKRKKRKKVPPFLVKSN